MTARVDYVKSVNSAVCGKVELGVQLMRNQIYIILLAYVHLDRSALVIFTELSHVTKLCTRLLHSLISHGNIRPFLSLPITTFIVSKSLLTHLDTAMC